MIYFAFMIQIVIVFFLHFWWAERADANKCGADVHKCRIIKRKRKTEESIKEGKGKEQVPQSEKEILYLSRSIINSCCHWNLIFIYYTL